MGFGMFMGFGMVMFSLENRIRQLCFIMPRITIIKSWMTLSFNL